MRNQAGKFIISGFAVLAIDAGVYAFLFSRLDPSAAKAIAFLCGIAASYALNAFWTFGRKKITRREIIKFIALYAITLGGNVAVNAVLLRVLGSPLFAYAAATGFAATINFIVLKYIVFHDLPFMGRVLRAPYRARHEENRMRHEGDVEAARKRFYGPGSPNLKFLLAERYGWMGAQIGEHERGIEVGCGSGVAKEFIRAKSFLLTDCADHPWLDAKNVDALRTPFRDAEFDFVVSNNMIHHLARPLEFFQEMARILKPGGRLYVQEINASLLMRFILRLMRHEGYSFEVDVFDRKSVCNDPEDPWSANCAIPNLLFDDAEKFRKGVPYFDMEKQEWAECLLFLNSGGVIANTISLPLPRALLRVVRAIDGILTRAAPNVLALQRRVILRKRNT